MAELKVKSKFFAMEDVLQTEDGAVVSEKEVKGLISADKEVIEKIVFSEGDEGTDLTFPEGVMPVLLYAENIGDEGIYVYFDYYNGDIFDEHRNSLGTIAIENNQITINLVNVEDLTTLEGGELIYFLFETAPSLLDSYYLFNPITKAGTKIYRHDIRIVNSTFSGGGLSMIIFSDKGTKLTSSSVNIGNVIGHDLSSSTGDNLSNIAILSFRYSGGFYTMKLIGEDTNNVLKIKTYNLSSDTTFSDTVSEL